MHLTARGYHRVLRVARTNSDLARSIPGAYEVVGAPRVEILEVLMPLRGAKVTAD